VTLRRHRKVTIGVAAVLAGYLLIHGVFIAVVDPPTVRDHLRTLSDLALAAALVLMCSNRVVISSAGVVVWRYGFRSRLAAGDIRWVWLQQRKRRSVRSYLRTVAGKNVFLGVRRRNEREDVRTVKLLGDVSTLLGVPVLPPQLWNPSPEDGPYAAGRPGITVWSPAVGPGPSRREQMYGASTLTLEDGSLVWAPVGRQGFGVSTPFTATVGSGEDQVAEAVWVKGAVAAANPRPVVVDLIALCGLTGLADGRRRVFGYLPANLFRPAVSPTHAQVQPLEPALRAFADTVGLQFGKYRAEYGRNLNKTFPGAEPGGPFYAASTWAVALVCAGLSIAFIAAQAWPRHATAGIRAWWAILTIVFACAAVLNWPGFLPWFRRRFQTARAGTTEPRVDPAKRVRLLLRVQVATVPITAALVYFGASAGHRHGRTNGIIGVTVFLTMYALVIGLSALKSRRRAKNPTG
jgi:hypothetical protein